MKILNFRSSAYTISTATYYLTTEFNHLIIRRILVILIFASSSRLYNKWISFLFLFFFLLLLSYVLSNKSSSRKSITIIIDNQYIYIFNKSDRNHLAVDRLSSAIKKIRPTVFGRCVNKFFTIIHNY